MRRIVTYLYEYNNGKRGSNLGFLKVDIMGKDVRLSLHAQDAGADRAEGEVWLVTKDSKGIRLGTIRPRGIVYDQMWSFAASRISDGEDPIGRIAGVGILFPNGRYFASSWTKEPQEDFLRGTFRTKGEANDGQTALAARPAGNRSSAIARPVSAARPAENRSSATARPASECPEEADSPAENRSSATAHPASEHSEAIARPTKVHSSAAVREPQTARQTDDRLHTAPAEPEERKTIGREGDVPPAGLSPEMFAKLQEAARLFGKPQPDNAGGDTSSEPSHQNITEADMPSWSAIVPNDDTDAERSNQLSGHMNQEPSQPVEHKTSTPSLQRIDLGQIRKLPKRNWYLCNNSFLIHGFFNYHYLVLRRVRENGVDKCYLGVPGIYEKPERAMAMLFGFPGFGAEDGTMYFGDEPEVKEGTFGYWYCLLDM